MPRAPVRIGSDRLMCASVTEATMPPMPATCWYCAAFRKAALARSTPISSLSQAG